jgi:hypothetical protein
MAAPVMKPVGERIERWTNGFVQAQIKGQMASLKTAQIQATTAAEKAKVAGTLATVQRRPIPQFNAFSISFSASESPRSRLYGIITGIIGLILNLIMLLGGIGLTGLKPWGYRATWWVCWAKLAMIAVFGIVTMTWILPLQLRDMRKQLDTTFMTAPGGAPPPTASPAAMAAMSTSAVVLFALLAMIYPILLLVQLRKPRVKVACLREQSDRGGVSWD